MVALEDLLFLAKHTPHLWESEIIKVGQYAYVVRFVILK